MYYIPLILVILIVATGQTTAADDKGSFAYLVEAKDSKTQGPCVLWYAERIEGEVRIIEPDQKDREIKFNIEAKAPAKEKVSCTTYKGPMGNTNATNVSIAYGNDQATVTFDLTFITYSGGYWELEDSASKITVQAGSTYEFNLTDNDFYANHEFSYSCNEFMVNTRDVKVDKSTRKLSLTVHRLQVQPYPRKTPRIVFHDSFDCSTWFTIPLWSGLAVSTLLTSILAMGVYALLMIKTPDRFESVKSKPLLIATSD